MPPWTIEPLVVLPCRQALLLFSLSHIANLSIYLLTSLCNAATDTGHEYAEATL